VARKAVQAAFWNYASFGAGKLLLFVTTAVLARLLTVEEFGTVGFATLVVTYLTAVKDLGLGAALIQRSDRNDAAAHTVFTLNLGLGAVLALASYGIAPLAAAYFREPMVTPLLRVLGLSFVFNALCGVHSALLQRELAFRRKIVPDLSRSLVKGIVSIGLALAGAGAWSLVIGQVASAAVGMVASWIVYPWRPRLHVDAAAARGLLLFGLSVLGIDAISVVTDNLDYLIIGRALGSADLGIYTLAYRLPELLVLNVLWILAAVLFPTYSMVKDQPDTLRSGFLVSLRYIELVLMPICLGLLIAADPIVRVAFGDQWLDAIPVVRVLALFALVNSIGFNVGDVYKAIGRPDILIKIELATLALLVPVLLIGVRYGILGVAYGHLVVATTHMIVRLGMAMRFVKISPGDIAAQLRPSVLAGAVLGVFALAAGEWTRDQLPLVQLAAVGFGGALGYLVTLWTIERETLRRASRLLATLPHEESATT
jgi:PST family polysaccharide transporter